MDNIYETIVSNNIYLVIVGLLLLVIVFSIVKKLFKLGIIVLICFGLWVGYIMISEDKGLDEAVDSVGEKFDNYKDAMEEQLDEVLHLIEKVDNDALPLPMASSLCNQEIITRCDQLICFAFHDSETLLTSCNSAEEMGKVVSLMFFD